MANEKSNIEETNQKLGTFETIIKETGQEITKLIPTLNTFFAVFSGAKIASSVKQMADFYQGFKNLSYQMGKSNTMSKDFLKNIYKIKIATGDTLNNLNEITVTLVKNRVEGGKTLQFLTKQVSFFAEATGASVDTSSQLAGNLHRIGHLGPKSISSIMTSMLKVQRTFGLTTEEVEGLSQNIIETTTELSNLGKTSNFIENFQKGTIKLAAAFRQVGLEASEATSIVDRLLDIDRLEDNMLLYAKMGISIQDAVAGNLDPNMMASQLQQVGQQIASMSRPAGAALARQMGISYRQALQFQNLKPAEDIKTEDSEMEKMAREQRTLWTKIEKALNSTLGAVALGFLQNPFKLGIAVVVAWAFAAKVIYPKMKKRFFAIADEVGNRFKEVLTKAFKESADQGIEKSNVVKGMKKNQGLKSRRIFSRDPLDVFNANKENAARWLGNEGIVSYQKALNAQTVFSQEASNRKTNLEDAKKELLARQSYLMREGHDRNPFENRELKYITKQLRIFEKELKNIETNTQETNAQLQKDVNKAIKGMSPEEKVAEINRLNEQRSSKQKELEQLSKQLTEQERLQGIIKQRRGTTNLNRASASELNDYFALGEREAQLQKVIDDLNEKMKGLTDEIDDLTKSSETLEQKWQEAGGGADTNTKQLFMGGWQKFTIGFKRALEPMGSVLKTGFGFVKKASIALGLGMIGLKIISKIMERFQPLFEQLSPVIEGIFDVLATMLAPLLKAVMKPVLWTLKGIYNGITWVAERFGLKTGNKIDFDKIMQNIDNWQVGQKLDDQAKSEEGAVVMSMQNGRWTAQNPDRAIDYWSGYGLGRDSQIIVDKLSELVSVSKATVGAIDNQTHENEKIFTKQNLLESWKLLKTPYASGAINNTWGAR